MMTTSLPADVYDRIVAVAERLFAEQGYDGTTLRHITREAGVNLAAVNYYHGDKQSLYLEVLRRRLQAANQERLSRLTEAEGEAGAAPVPLDSLLEMMAAPLFDLHRDPHGGRHGARLIGRILTEPLPFTEKFIADELQPVLARFAQAIRRHSPALPPAEFLWRFSFVVGSLHHMLATLHRMPSLTRGICRDDDHAGARAQFVSLATGVLRLD